jgi:hypothetical protein
MLNPFVFSNPDPKTFVGRAKEIRRITSFIKTRQSVAITGEPRIGKTSLLRYISAADRRPELYGEFDSHLLFQYIDAQALGPTFTQAQFWQLALQPIEELAKTDNGVISTTYTTCKNRGFRVFDLERLLLQLQTIGWHLIILLDEFDSLLDHLVVNKSEFYGGLRSLASRNDSLSIITASRQPLDALNTATQEYSRLGSPYFNFMNPVLLGAFAEKDVQTLLARGNKRFTKEDKEFLVHIAGQHPCLLQAGSFALWEAYEDSGTRQTRWNTASNELLETARTILIDTWRGWPPEARKAVTIIALDTMPRPVTGKEFDIDALLAELPTYTPEIDQLRKRGFLVIDGDTKSCYHLQSKVMLWWLADELIRSVRPQEGEDLGKWLRKQAWDSILKDEEKTQLKRALTVLGDALKHGGVETFIKASIKEFANLAEPILKPDTKSEIPAQNASNTGISVFLCHSTEDKPIVRELHRRLIAENGIDPWFDEEKLLPGEDWDLEIRKAISKSDVVIICLSATSINKGGYIQKEIKLALDIASEKPEGMIFIIPLKLTECTVPDSLKSWQWSSYYDNGAYARLIASLRKRAQTLGKKI